MSILGTIMSKIFGEDHAAASPAAKPADTSSAPPTTTAEEKTAKANTWQDAPTNQNAATTGSASPAAAPQPSAAQAATAPKESVDVAAELDAMEHAAGERLDWRHSIVDLMKLLRMDSSLSARKELAHELSYSGDTEDSATMNVWLHKEVMKKLAQNGGTLPADMH